MYDKTKVVFDSCGSIETPIGPVSVYGNGDSIVLLEMVHDRAPNTQHSPIVSHALAQLSNYFAGTSRVLDFKVKPEGTEFQKAVWGQIAKVPFGDTITYAQIAAKIGKPLASRAVGGAVGANPVALVIGCHRVMGASGKITGFSGGEGIPTKRWLLAHEQITSKD